MDSFHHSPRAINVCYHEHVQQKNRFLDVNVFATECGLG